MLEISIIVPCYNAGRLLAETYETIASQEGDFCVKEILIVNDRSDDPETLAVLRQLAATENVRILNNAGPRGPAGARNAGIKECSAEWLKFHDADDPLLPGALQALTAASENFPNAAWIGGDYYLKEGNSEELRGPMLKSAPLVKSHLDEAYKENRPILLERPTEIFLKASLSHTCSSIIVTDVVREVGGFDEDLRFQQDYHLFLRLTRRADFVFVPTPVMIYRLHGASHTYGADGRLLAYRAKGLRRLKDDPDFADFQAQLDTTIFNTLVPAVRASRYDGEFIRALVLSLKALSQRITSNSAWREVIKSLIACILFGKFYGKFE